MDLICQAAPSFVRLYGRLERNAQNGFSKHPHTKPIRFQIYPHAMPRILELLLVIVTAPLWAPLALVIAVGVRLGVGSPIIFRQPRPGRDGKLFTLFKFRTMRDAEGLSGEALSDAERLTPLGSWIRSTSLDELPELINVLRGEMSLVGPRPLLPQYLPLYSAKHLRRHAVRPGITGLAQVNGRNALDWPSRFEMDVWYVEHRSLILDLRILLATIRRVIRREGIRGDGEATMSAFTGYDRPA